MDRSRLVDAGFLKEVLRGWYVPARPDESVDESTAWFASFWGFIAAYLTERLGNDWVVSPDQSLLLDRANEPSLASCLYGLQARATAQPNSSMVLR